MPATPTLRDPECAIAHPSHVCRNRDGDPIREGQACWTAARLDTLGLRDVAA